MERVVLSDSNFCRLNIILVDSHSSRISRQIRFLALTWILNVESCAKRQISNIWC